MKGLLAPKEVSDIIYIYGHVSECIAFRSRKAQKTMCIYIDSEYRYRSTALRSLGVSLYVDIAKR